MLRAKRLPTPHRLSAVVLFAYIGLIGLPNSTVPTPPGLDLSWMWALNELAHSPYRFGRDVVFTYGPLVYALQGSEVHNNFIISKIITLLIYCIFLISWGSLLLKPTSAKSALLSLIGLLASLLLGLQYGAIIFIAVGTLCLISIRFSRHCVVILSIAYILSFILHLMKPSIGITCLSLAISCTLVMTFVLRRLCIWQAVTPPVLGAAVLVVTSLLTMGSIDSAIRWEIYSLQLMSEYGVAMSTPGSLVTLLIGVLSLCLILLWFLLLAYWRGPAFYAVLVFIPCLLLAFKHGYVRQDTHAILFLPVVPAVIAITAVFARPGWEQRLGGLALAVSVLMTIPSALAYRTLTAQTAVAFLRGDNARASFAELLDPPSMRAQLETVSRQALGAKRLPSEWTDLVRAPGRSVDVLPSELSYVPANSLPWRPQPLLQNYLAFTADLDHLNASHFADPDRAPDYLIIEYIEIDGRNPVLTAPATWRAILENYEPASVPRLEHALLLQRRKVGTSVAMTEIRREWGRTGDFITVPQSSGLVYVRLFMTMRAAGLVAKAALRVPPVTLDVRYADGQEASYRVTPDTLRNGALLNVLPRSLDDFGMLLRGLPGNRAVAFRISGPGAAYFRPDLALEWLEGKDGLVAMRQAAPDPAQLVLTTAVTHLAVDTINGARAPLPGGETHVDPTRTPLLTVAGWAADTRAGKPAQGVILTIDGAATHQASYGFDRLDVAQFLKLEDFRFTGYSISIPASELSSGPHKLLFQVISFDGKYIYDPGVEFTVHID